MKKVLLIVLLLAVIGGIYYFFKIRSAPQQIPAGAVDLKFPLKDGPFEAIQSGPNGDTHNLPVEKYALDIARPTTISDWLKFRKSNLESNTTFGTPVYGPCTGPVTIAVDGFPDVPIGLPSTPDKSNHVTVNCGQFYVAMVHFKKGSILVKVGDVVTAGQQIGLIGNSGHTSGPHLHIMAYRMGPNPDDDRIALPITFGGKYLFRGDTYP